MPDYKEMYLHLFRATERAVNLLIQAQQDCEEIYMQDETETEQPSGGENGEKAQSVPAAAAIQT